MMTGGGAGFIADMITRMRNNRELVHKKGYFKSVDKYLEDKHYLKLRFKKVSNKEMESIKNHIQEDAKKNKQALTYLLMLFAVISIGLLVWVIRAITKI